MKYVKRISCFVMALVMICSMLSMGAFAADGTSQKGSITITGVNPDSTAEYRIYKMMDLTEYVIDGQNSRFVYEMEENWEDFFRSEAVQEFITWVATNNPAVESKYFTWNTNPDATTEQKNIDKFAALALAYVNEHSDTIKPLASNVPDVGEIKGELKYNAKEEPMMVFSDLPLGYYLIDSNVGALCGLTTTAPDAAMNAKNVIPTIDKQVKENSEGEWYKQNDASIGQIVEFKTTINVTAGHENYVLHDYMSEGLTFVEVTDVKHKDKTTGNSDSAADKGFYTVITEGISDCEYAAEGYECAFHVVFTPKFHEHLQAGDSVEVDYTAKVNENAIILPELDTNNSRLEYGVGNVTVPSETKTYTYGFDIVKTDGTNALISGAGFKIYTAAEDGAIIPVEKVTENGETFYRVMTCAKIDAQGNYLDENNAIIEGVNIMVGETEGDDLGQARIHGLDSGTYYLEETVKPEGYNGLQHRQAFTINHNNKFASFTEGTSGTPIYSTGSGVHVVNNAGVMMPETGGIGTTLFYVGGGIMVFAAVVLLITKKRMAAKD